MNKYVNKNVLLQKAFNTMNLLLLLNFKCTMRYEILLPNT